MNKQIQHPIRFAIVGTGFSEQHLNWMNKVDGLCCNALLYHSNSERAFALAKDFGIRNVSNDLDEIIGSKDIDGVVIVSPPDTHEQIALAALSHNLLVICDKPLSSTLESAELLCKHDAEYGGKSKLMFQWRLHPALLGAKSKIELGSLGDILHMSLSFQHDFLANRTTATPWRHSYLRAGGGALGDMGVHLFDLIHFLFPANWTVSKADGGIARRTRMNGKLVVECDTEDYAWVSLVSDSLAQADVSVSRITFGVRELKLLLTFSGGTLCIRICLDSLSAKLTTFNAMGDSELLEYEASAFNPYRFLISDWEKQTKNFASFRDGVNAQRILTQAVAKLFANS